MSAAPTNALPVMTGKRRKRRTKAELAVLREAIYSVCRRHQPLTVWQAFYRLVVTGVIEKTQREHKNTVVTLIGKMRDSGDLPFSWIVDNTRLMRKPRSYDTLAAMLQHQQDFYRKNIWATQDAYVEIWCESDSAAGVLAPITQRWDVPLMSARGFSSKTFLHSAAPTIDWRDKPAYLYYFGDYDPSGVHIDRNVERGLERYGATDFEFRRIAVTAEQIELLQLPGTPPKASDSRSRGFSGQAVEIEAIAPAKLREICEQCITDHIDDDALARAKVVEEAELATLARIAEGLQ